MQKTDYKSMYCNLFNAITDAVEILQQAQRDAEEIYINTSEDEDEYEYEKEAE